MEYYPQRAAVVLFGGVDSNGSLLNDTWEWNGTSWVSIGSHTAPAARMGHAMSYDPGEGSTPLRGHWGEIILFGGESASGLKLGDTWAYRSTGTRYVRGDVGFDQRNDCLDKDHPCATINYAIGRAFPGDEIRVGSGDFGMPRQPCVFCEEVVLVDKDWIGLTGGWNTSFTAQDGVTTISGSSYDGDQVRCLTVTEGAAAYVQGIRFEFGRARIGGAIFNKVLLILDDVYVGSAKASYAGGGIFSTADGELRLKNSVIAWNSAPYGGGVFSQGYLTILNTSLEFAIAPTAA